MINILVHISSDNCLVPVSRQSKPWTNAELLSIGTCGTTLHLLSDLDLISHASCGRWPNDLGRYSVTLKFPLASHAVCLRIVGCLPVPETFKFLGWSAWNFAYVTLVSRGYHPPILSRIQQLWIFCSLYFKRFKTIYIKCFNRPLTLCL